MHVKKVPVQNAFYICGLTGGPFFPIPALIHHLPELNPILIGVKNSFEQKAAISSGLQILYLPEAKLSFLSFAKLPFWQYFLQVFVAIKAVFLLLFSFCKCIYFLIKYQPAIVYSSGSFLAVPMIYATSFLNWLDLIHTKIIVHQQDPMVGLSNSLVAPKADLLTCLFEYSKKNNPKFAKAKIIPNPIVGELYKNESFEDRGLELFIKNKTIQNEYDDHNQVHYQELSGKKEESSILLTRVNQKSVSSKLLYMNSQDIIEIEPNPDTKPIQPKPIIKSSTSNYKKPLILIFGGGSGARDINNWVLKTKYYRVIHLTGILQKDQFPKIKNPDYCCRQIIIGDMPKLFFCADLVLCRAGLGSISQLLYLQKPAFLVPLPNSHQEVNAEQVSDKFFVLDAKGSDFWLEKLNYYYPTFFEKIKHQSQNNRVLQLYYHDIESLAFENE
jgi:UDP-N-acetylglucosamine:LPS N-acetylglucosamine transferase